jgi:hypothetical protein
MSQDLTSPASERKEPPFTDESLGIAGRTARFFIRSPLSPLFYVAMLLMGLLGLFLTPARRTPRSRCP